MYNARILKLDSAIDTFVEYAKITGSFTREQAVYMRPDLNENAIDSALNRAVNQKRLARHGTNGKEFRLNSFIEYSQENSDALWPVLVIKGEKIFKKDDNMWLSAGTAPVTLIMYLDNILYNIVRLNNENKSILTYIDKEYERNREANAGEERYVFIIENESEIDKFPLIEAPHQFCIINGEGYDNPVSFIED